jgi:hypothetical protein
MGNSSGHHDRRWPIVPRQRCPESRYAFEKPRSLRSMEDRHHLEGGLLHFDERESP